MTQKLLVQARGDDEREGQRRTKLDGRSQEFGLGYVKFRYPGGSAHQEPRTIVAVGGGVGVWAGCVLTSGSALQMRRALFLGASALLLLVLNHNVVREVK